MSGDTAVPFPESVPADGSMLTASQRRRVEAILQARKIVENRPGIFGGGSVPEQRSVLDLMNVADWIIDGPQNDGEPEITDTQRTWRLGYGEGVHAALVKAPSVTPEQADAIKAELGVIPVREPSAPKLETFMDLPPTGALAENDVPADDEIIPGDPDHVGRWEPGPPSVPDVSGHNDPDYQH